MKWKSGEGEVASWLLGVALPTGVGEEERRTGRQ